MLTEGITAFREALFIANQKTDPFDLPAGEFEGEQFYPCFIAIGRPTDDANEFIEISERDEITFERLRALFRLAQLEARPAHNDFAPMFDESGVGCCERKEFWLPVIDLTA